MSSVAVALYFRFSRFRGASSGAYFFGKVAMSFGALVQMNFQSRSVGIVSDGSRSRRRSLHSDWATCAALRPDRSDLEFVRPRNRRYRVVRPTFARRAVRLAPCPIRDPARRRDTAVCMRSCHCNASPELKFLRTAQDALLHDRCKGYAFMQHYSDFMVRRVGLSPRPICRMLSPETQKFAQ